MTDSQRRIAARYWRALADMIEAYPGHWPKVQDGNKRARIFGGDIRAEDRALMLRNEQYVFLFTDCTEAEAIEAIRHYAEEIESGEAR